MKLKVVWDKESIFQLQDIYDYLNRKSSKAANKVRKTILSDFRALPNHPEIYPPDIYKRPINNSFRAFEKYNLRVSYHITESEIRILRIRHTKREPKKY